MVEIMEEKSDLEKVIGELSSALVQMHGLDGYVPQDVDDLEDAAWKALAYLKSLPSKKEKVGS